MYTIVVSMSKCTNNRLASVVSALMLQILHSSTIFSTGQLLLLTSSFANAILTPHMGVAYSWLDACTCILTRRENENKVVSMCICISSITVFITWIMQWGWYRVHSLHRVCQKWLNYWWRGKVHQNTLCHLIAATATWLSGRTTTRQYYMREW